MTWGLDDFHTYKEKELQASELERELAATQLEALKLRLHPPFLFNTLSTILPLIRSEPSAAARTVVQLGDILRLALHNDAKSLVPLETELDYIRLYLQIEQTRLRDRLEVVFAIEPETLEAAVPNLVLLPLCEGAIANGASRRPGRARVEIRARRDGLDLRLEVDEAPVSDTAGTPSAAIDDAFVRKTRLRLDLLYPGAHAVDVSDRLGGGPPRRGHRFPTPSFRTRRRRRGVPRELEPERGFRRRHAPTAASHGPGHRRRVDGRRPLPRRRPLLQRPLPAPPPRVRRLGGPRAVAAVRLHLGGADAARRGDRPPRAAAPVPLGGAGRDSPRGVARASGRACGGLPGRLSAAHGRHDPAVLARLAASALGSDALRHLLGDRRRDVDRDLRLAVARAGAARLAARDAPGQRPPRDAQDAAPPALPVQHAQQHPAAGLPRRRRRVAHGRAPLRPAAPLAAERGERPPAPAPGDRAPPGVPRDPADALPGPPVGGARRRAGRRRRPRSEPHPPAAGRERDQARHRGAPRRRARRGPRVPGKRSPARAARAGRRPRTAHRAKRRRPQGRRAAQHAGPARAPLRRRPRFRLPRLAGPRLRGRPEHSARVRAAEDGSADGGTSAPRVSGGPAARPPPLPVS